MIREPARAGTFYPGSEDRCRKEADRLTADSAAVDLPPKRLVGGIVPHAGWAFSGPVAGQVLATLAARRPETVVLFGAVHHRRGREAWLFGSGAWETPLGRMEVDERLADRVLGHTNLILSDPYAHEKEHSLEVQIPLLQATLPQAKILPVLVPPMDTAVEVGAAVAGTIVSYGYDAVFVGSTDLTHYGPSYGMVAHGKGADGVRWAKDVNDQRMIDVMLRLDERQVVHEALEHHNACGAGAIAATIAACKRCGARSAQLLRHTSSAEVMPGRESSDAVGYAGLVFLAGEE